MARIALRILKVDHDGSGEIELEDRAKISAQLSLLRELQSLSIVSFVLWVQGKHCQKNQRTLLTQ